MVKYIRKDKMGVVVPKGSRGREAEGQEGEGVTYSGQLLVTVCHG